MNSRGRRLIFIPLGLTLLLFGGASLLAEDPPPARSCCAAKAAPANQTTAGQACCAAGAQKAQATEAKKGCCAAPADQTAQTAAAAEKSCCAAGAQMAQTAQTEDKSCCDTDPAKTKALDYERTLASYSIPDVTLIDQDGRKVSVRELMSTDKPVMVNFVFTTCTTICPILSASFADMQRELGSKAEDVLFVSFSIDPEYDTPELMNEYLERFDAQPGWVFLTGNRTDIESVMRAFDAYVANKMSHLPLTFLRASGADKWVRINGLIGTSEFMREFEQLARN